MAQSGAARPVGFLINLISFNLTDFSIIILAAAVFVNGFTDAPNAIVNCVASGCLPFKKAAFMAALCNLTGTAAGFYTAKPVANAVSGLVRFSDPAKSQVAVAASLAAVAVWSVAAWRFGIPTSESHALAAGLAGAALACKGTTGAFSSAAFGGGEWLKLLSGLLISVPGGFLMGNFAGAVLKKRKFTDKTYRRSQITAAAATAFMHGAQDGLKFIGIYIILSDGACPFYVPAVCGLVMAFGTRMGGRRIIENVGVKMVTMQKYQGVAADTASFICLFCLTAAGIPVSTTHTKTAAIMGCCHEKMNKNIARSIGAAWLFTFPCCAAISCLITLIIILVQ